MALCCLTHSGYRCFYADKDGLLSTCSMVISFKVSIQVWKYWQLVGVGGGLVTVLFEASEGVICRTEVVRGHEQKGILMTK